MNELHGNQIKFVNSTERELIINGPYGSGKTFALFADALKDVHDSRSRGVMVFHTKLLMQMAMDERGSLMTQAGGVWNKQFRHFTFPSGAKIRFDFMREERDWLKHCGHAYSFVGWDNLHMWDTDYLYVRMFSRVRTWGGIICRSRATANFMEAAPYWILERSQFKIIGPSAENPHLTH